MPYGDRLHDCGADTGIYHYLDRCLIFTLVASVLTKALEAVSLGWLNRMLRARSFEISLLVSLVICVIQFIDSDSQLISQTKKEQSLLYYPMESFAGIFFPQQKRLHNNIYSNKMMQQEEPNKYVKELTQESINTLHYGGTYRYHRRDSMKTWYV